MIRAMCLAAMFFVALLSNAQAQAVTTVASVPFNPADMAPIGGDVLLLAYGGTTISRVTPTGAVTPFATITGAFFDRALVVGHDGAYYATTNHSGIVRISGSGVITPFASGLPVSNSGGLIYNPVTGAYYFDSQDNGNVYTVTTSGVASLYATTPAAGLGGITVDAAGNLYVVSNDSGDVYKITTPTAPVVTKVGSVGAGAYFDITIDGAGNLYVPAINVSKIFMLTQAGVASTFAAGSPLNSPFRAKVSGGNLYVSDFTSRKLFSVSGTVSAPPAPVPTMSQWTMILFALALAGGAGLLVHRRYSAL
jgi:hypothetical protein